MQYMGLKFPEITIGALYALSIFNSLIGGTISMYLYGKKCEKNILLYSELVVMIRYREMTGWNF